MTSSRLRWVLLMALRLVAVVVGVVVLYQLWILSQYEFACLPELNNCDSEPISPVVKLVSVIAIGILTLLTALTAIVRTWRRARVTLPMSVVSLAVSGVSLWLAYYGPY
jgi:hypothetical protein